MVAEMNRMENAARVAMADMGAGSRSAAEHPGIRFMVKLGLALAALALAGLIAASLV